MPPKGYKTVTLREATVDRIKKCIPRKSVPEAIEELVKNHEQQNPQPSAPTVPVVNEGLNKWIKDMMK